MRRPPKKREPESNETELSSEEGSMESLSNATEDVVEESYEEQQPRGPAPAPVALTIKVSAALQRKLQHHAQDEGITIDEYISELLAEGVTLRAFEIVERKFQMRGGGGPQQGGGGGGQNRGGGGGNNQNRNNNN